MLWMVGKRLDGQLTHSITIQQEYTMGIVVWFYIQVEWMISIQIGIEL